MTLQKKRSLTEGSIWKGMITFALPILLGNIFQQLYNTVDSYIVGNYIGSQALGAVTATGSLVMLIVGFFTGTAIGAGVVISMYYGAKDPDGLRRAVHTDMAFALAAGLVVSLLGYFLAPVILQWMGTPKEILPLSVSYLRVYFSGALTLVIYNISTGILQALGDSRHPLYYLILSSVINVVLDYLFVAVLGWGVWSAALATIMSQFVSAALCLHRLTHLQDEWRLQWKKIRFDDQIIRQIIRFGLPSGVQNSVICLANVIIQSVINSFGVNAVSGCGSYVKIEGFGFLPITCFSLALTTFIGQNLGAKQYDRARRGARFGIICSVAMAETVGIIFYLFAPQLVGIFTHEPEVIAFGVRQARTVTLFYCLLALSHCMAGVMRGAGKARVPMIVMLSVWCVFRIIYIKIATTLSSSIDVVFWAYPLTWFISSVIFIIYYSRANWLHALDKEV